MVLKQNFREEKLPLFGRRHVQCVLLFCGLASAYAMRVNMSVAIVAMMDKNAANPNFAEYKWPEQTKSKVLSSFFCGYVCSQIPAGSWARRFGGKVILLFAITSSSLFAFLSPLVIQSGSSGDGNWQVLCVLRFLQGVGQGATIPSLMTLQAKWSPLEERSSIATYIHSGSQFGTVVMLASSGFLASSPLGWPGIFYVPACVGLLWAIVWLYFGANSPHACKAISHIERSYIETSLQGHAKSDAQQIRNGGDGGGGGVSSKVPWNHIISSPPFLALLLAHCGNSFGHWMLLTQIPFYMKSVLGKDIKSNSLLSSLPYLCMVILGFACCPLVSAIEKSRVLSITACRKIANTIGQWVPAMTIICLGYVDAEQSNFAVVLLVVTISINTITHFGWQVNHIDLSPNFAGTLAGMTNTAANVMSVIAPLIVGYIVTDPTNARQWRIVFYIAGGYYFIANLCFIIFGTAKVQPWNDLDAGIKMQELKPLNESALATKVIEKENEKM